ncbi:hypothetical protein ABT001_34685 [Streptomyces sp. NPDC002793]|uniref:hypothetical protein n=1 Tax=Streptomyces sp. NPDC002793 TaxID=3154432 RepID=UPI00332E84AE
MNTSTLALGALGAACVTAICIVAIRRAHRSDVPDVMRSVSTLAAAVLAREG